MTTGKPLVFTNIANTELTPMMRPARLKPSKHAPAPAAGDPALWRSLDGNLALYLLLLTLLQRNASLPDGRRCNRATVLGSMAIAVAASLLMATPAAAQQQPPSAAPSRSSHERRPQIHPARSA